jgi:hypothetical protein
MDFEERALPRRNVTNRSCRKKGLTLIEIYGIATGKKRGLQAAIMKCCVSSGSPAKSIIAVMAFAAYRTVLPGEDVPECQELGAGRTRAVIVEDVDDPASAVFHSREERRRKESMAQQVADGVVMPSERWTPFIAGSRLMRRIVSNVR